MDRLSSSLHDFAPIRRAQSAVALNPEDWLQQRVAEVKISLRLCVLGRVLDGVGMILQSALIAMIVASLIMDEYDLQQNIYPLIGLGAVFVCRALCSYFAETVAISVGARVRQSVRLRLVEKIHRLGSGFVKTRNSGELSAIVVEQVDALQGYFAEYLPQRTSASILPLVILTVVFSFDWVAGLILLITGPLIPLFMILVGVGAEAASRKKLVELRRMSGHFLDRIRGLATLKLFGQAQRELENIGLVSNRYRRSVIEVLRIAFLSSAVLEFFSAIAVALIAVYLGFSLLGLIDIGWIESPSYFTAFFLLLLAPEFFTPMRRLASHYHSKADAIAAAEAIIAILMRDDFENGGPRLYRDHRTESLVGAGIEFKNVSKTFANRQTPVLNDLSFLIDSGRTCSLVGESGVGKSTVISLILGFETPDSGLIRVANQTIKAPGERLQQPNIAWLGQRPYMFAASLRENIAMFDPSIDSEKLMSAALAAGVLEFSDRFPDGLDTRVGDQGFGLSGGQRQRVALARAFLKQAPILVLDEPTANLDYSNAVAILDTLQTMFAGRTIVIATHSQLVIERSDCQVNL